VILVRQISIRQPALRKKPSHFTLITSVAGIVEDFAVGGEIMSGKYKCSGYEVELVFCLAAGRLKEQVEPMCAAPFAKIRSSWANRLPRTTIRLD
jgi:hypothetical protein